MPLVRILITKCSFDKVVTTDSNPGQAPIIEPVASPVSAPKPNQRPSIPYPSRLSGQKLRDKANDQKEKFFQIFKDLNFNISIADALILMPKFGPSIKSLLTNKDKLFELARTPLNEHCSTVLLKKLPEKLGDPGKFLISCDFPEMAECLALADLGASINLMPLSESFHFLADFVVVDFDAYPRVPLIFGRYFLKTERDLIDVFEGEPTLHVGKEAITFNLDQTSRYSANYNDMTANRIDVVDMACEEYSQECMQTRSSSRLVSNPSSNLTPSINPNRKGRNRRRSKQRIENFNLEEPYPPIVTMADQRTMAQLLQAPTEDYEDAIVVPAITADNFELNHGL
nr:reverse transcriptase domain-containing protein [Tanacetum cinerariifolium]